MEDFLELRKTLNHVTFSQRSFTRELKLYDDEISFEIEAENRYAWRTVIEAITACEANKMNIC